MTVVGLLRSPSPNKASAGRARAYALDAVRGLACWVMLADHLALFLGADAVRSTVGRLAMPLFFVVAGHLSRRLSSRLVLVAGWGLCLPTFAPWIDSPNVLVLLATGAFLLSACRRWSVHPGWLAAVCLGLLANGAGPLAVGSYPPAALVGLMALGAMLHRDAFAWGERLPGWVAWLGRWPLSFYVGHVLLLTAVASWL